jgi:plastocyanin
VVRRQRLSRLAPSRRTPGRLAPSCHTPGRLAPSRAGSLLALSALTAVALLGGLLTAPARAADAKVAIGHYRWSQTVVHVDLGQRVTWYWVGPDTMHSVTGISANDAGEDSDPHNSQPDHRLGSTFHLSFTQPGVYEFQCKLHPVVRGEVIVSGTPGDPGDDPDPIPKLNVDLTRPRVSDLFLERRSFSAAGTTLDLALDDPSLIDAEIWHVAHGHRAAFAGWQQWRAHIGFNYLPFASRAQHFRPEPGRYVAFVKATDLFENVSGTHRISFRIAAPRRRR